MKYWRLYNSAEKEVGFVPQIVDPIFDGYYTDENQLWNQLFKKIGKTTIIPKGQLQKKAKLTDLMSVGFSSGDLFLSEKLRQILEAHNVEGVQFADTEIITKKGDNIQSNIMHPYETDYEFLDVLNSEFRYINAMGDQTYGTIHFKNVSEYFEAKIKNKMEMVKVEDLNEKRYIVINSVNILKDSPYDLVALFGIRYGAVGYYVSQRLKDKILNEKCTGVIFREVNEVYP
jgi:hypothetical protein